MLESLTVKNFAIIDNISIDFKEGFTAITGETGAGKSLLIDAIGLLLGDRASTSMVRNGCTKAIIEGVFTNIGTKTLEILEELGLNDDLEEDLIIKKEININGKSTVRINGFTISNSELERIAETLADIHTQNDTKKLFDPKNYLNFIDDIESHVNGKDGISLSVTGLTDLYKDEDEFDPCQSNIVDFLVDENIKTVRNTTHYGNEFISRNKISSDKIVAADIRIINYINNLGEKEGKAIFSVINKYNQIIMMSKEILTHNRNIQMREMSEGVNRKIDVEKMSEMPRLLMIK